MKKTKFALRLGRETIRPLTYDETRNVAGGATYGAYSCALNCTTICTNGCTQVVCTTTYTHNTDCS